MEKIRFMFDYCASSCLWGGEGVLPLENFPISDGLKATLRALCREYDACLNWNDPASGTVWTEAQWESFRMRALSAYDALTAELNGVVQVQNDLHLSIG